MSLLSAVAEHADLADLVTHPAARAGLQPIAGRFQVVRQAFGATQMPLRDVVLDYLQKGLARLDVKVAIPPMDQTPNTQDLLTTLMQGFHQKYPEHGLLVVIDELLEYLLGRKERELIVDLAFLREMGEACIGSDLRFVAGIQESLFDNPRFQFAADSIRRVRDRYQQVRIVREDVAFVVARRLLAKTAAQKQWIRAYLEPFVALYDLMAERLDEFVELFPIHPAYLEMFERVTVIEKRQALKAISLEMRRVLNDEIPAAAPGLISFDAFWRTIQEDPVYRATPEIREVSDKSLILQERVQNALPHAHYRPAALRIIYALSLHRLTTGDLRAPIGLTPQELRDRLCLHLPIPEPDAGFLLTSVESVLQEISRAVSGQFISHNRENDQYYLDLDKDIDIDALIEQRAATLDTDTLDRYYFDALIRILELTDSAYVPGFRIWQRDLLWTAHGVTRDGYVFLGAVNERSTAHPERDFYVHFLGLYTPNGKKDQPQKDEVFFVLKNADDGFQQTLRRYAGAREMSTLSSGSNKTHYERKADAWLQQLTRWLRENFARAFEVRYLETSGTVAERSREYRVSLSAGSLREQVFQVAAAILASHFDQTYHDYPTFRGLQLTSVSLPQAAQAALRVLAGGAANIQAQSLLEGLALAQSAGNALRYTVQTSPYAVALLQQLDALGPGQVLNRRELIGGDTRREREWTYKLEPELLMVLLAALLRQGEITLTWMGRTFASDDLDEVARLSVDDLARFSAIARPKPVPEQALRALLEGLHLPEVWLTDPTQHERAAQELCRLAQTGLPRVALALESLREGLKYWSAPILTAEETAAWRKALEAYRELLQTLERMTTPGRLRAFALGVGEVRARVQGRETLRELTDLRDLLQTLQPHLLYLTRAELRLPKSAPWHTEAGRVRQEHLTWLRQPEQRREGTLYARLNGSLSNLRTAYGEAYCAYHQTARLDRAGDARKRALTQDPHWRQLLALQDMTILPESELRRLQKQINELRSCPTLTPADMKDHAECPHCGFDPRTETTAKPVLADLEEASAELPRLHAAWMERLRAELNKPQVAGNVALLKSPHREQIQTLMQTGALPERVTQEWVEAVNDALRGLEKVTFDGTELRLALTRPGMPCTVEELQQRFVGLLDQKLGDKNRHKVRLEIDW